MRWLLLLIAAAATSAAPLSAAVRPGGVVRWPSDEGRVAEACVQGDDRWRPLAGTCFYPVDLFTREGTVLELGRVVAGKTERRSVRVGDYPYPTQRVTIGDQGKVDLSAADAARAAREQAKLSAIFRRRSERRYHLPLGEPLRDLPPGGRFGSRRLFNDQPRSPHTGADYAARTGTPVLAVERGTVVLAEEHFFPGKMVIVDHGEGLFTMSFHLDRIDVNVGDEVERGTPLGTVGATGRASGPHLHFGVRWREARVDPEILFGREKTTPP